MTLTSIFSFRTFLLKHNTQNETFLTNVSNDFLQLHDITDRLPNKRGQIKGERGPGSDGVSCRLFTHSFLIAAFSIQRHRAVPRISAGDHYLIGWCLLAFVMRLLTGIGFCSHPSRCSEGLLSTSGKIRCPHIVPCLYGKRLLMKHLFGGLHQVIFFLPLSSATHPALITWSTRLFPKALDSAPVFSAPKSRLKVGDRMKW